MLRILVTHLAVPFVSTFVFLLHLVVICDLLKTEQTTWPTWREGLDLFLGISLFKRYYLWHVNAVFDLNNFLLHKVGLECQYYAFNFPLGHTLFTIFQPPLPQWHSCGDQRTCGNIFEEVVIILNLWIKF